jgi:FkbM family methyltransferase
LSKEAIVVDCGTANIPDFSENIIRKYGIQCHGFEPTRKHHGSLANFVKKYGGLFEYHDLAISDKRGTRVFHESSENIVGSLCNDHDRVINDTIISYEVKTITLDDLFEYLGISHIDILKMDIEGEEYAVLNTVSEATLRKITQIAVEFHAFCVGRYVEEDTCKVIQRLENIGFKYFTYDKINYLFYRN